MDCTQDRTAAVASFQVELVGLESYLVVVVVAVAVDHLCWMP